MRDDLFQVWNGGIELAFVNFIPQQWRVAVTQTIIEKNVSSLLLLRILAEYDQKSDRSTNLSVDNVLCKAALIV